VADIQDSADTLEVDSTSDNHEEACRTVAEERLRNLVDEGTVVHVHRLVVDKSVGSTHRKDVRLDIQLVIEGTCCHCLLETTLLFRRGSKPLQSLFSCLRWRYHFLYQTL
jgi:hypothetical protein